MSTSKAWNAKLNSLRAEIDSYGSVLTYAQLVKIAQKQGWMLDKSRGKGSHRCLVQPGYRAITLKCHGSKTEMSASVTKKHLEEIYYPKLQAILQESTEARISDDLEHFSVEIATHLQTIRTEAHQKLEDLEARLANWEQQAQADINQRIQQYETLKLEECDRATQDLLTEEQQKVFQEQAFMLQQTQQDLAIAQAQGQTLEQHLQQHQREIAHQHQNYQVLQQRLQQQQTEFEAFRRRQRWKDWLTLAGAALFGTLCLAQVRPTLRVANGFGIPSQGIEQSQ